MTLSRDEILNAALQQRVVDVPELGGKVVIRELTGAERDRWDDWSIKQTKTDGVAENASAQLVVMALVDENGQRLFTDDEAALLGQTVSGKVLDRLWRIAAALSGIRQDDVDELLGNSGGGPAADSPSG